MTKDIREIIEDWEYREDCLCVRKIVGLDGKEKIQLRLELGLMQMEVIGRPDGQRPYGQESLLDYYHTLMEEHKAKYGTLEHFRLDTDDCVKLQMEAFQYYHRRISLFEFQEYEAVRRDAEHNLRIFSLVSEYASNDQDKVLLDQYRAYVITHRVKAEVLFWMEKKDHERALRAIQQGIKEIEDFYREYGRVDLIEEGPDIQYLKDWAKEIEQNRPVTPRRKLEAMLQAAVKREDYEQASRLRDQIKAMEE